MSRLFLLTSLTAVILLGGGVGGLVLDQEGPAHARLPTTPVPASLSVKPSVVGQNAPKSPDRQIYLRPGESLAEGLIRSGVGGLDAALADQAMADYSLLHGRPVKLWLGEALPGGARSLESLNARAGGGLLLTLARRDESFERNVRKLNVDETPIRLRLGKGESIEALNRFGLPVEALRQVRGLAGTARLSGLDLIIAHEESEGASSYGPLLYVSASLASGEVRRWLGDGGGGLRALEPTGRMGGLQRPVPGRVTSAMGLRFHPVLRFLRWHRGTDFAAPAGSPVQAAAEGRVISAGWSGGYGRLVRLEHADGTSTAYAHLSAILVREGDHLPQGATLGLVGASGLATGPHLHFEWVRGRDVLQPAFAAHGTGTMPLDDARRAALRTLLAAPFREPPVGRS